MSSFEEPSDVSPDSAGARLRRGCASASAERRVDLDHRRAASRAGGRRLARLSPHLRRSSLQPFARDQPPQRRAVAARLGVHDARQQPLGRNADRRQRAHVRRRRQRARASRSTPSRASSSGRTCARIRRTSRCPRRFRAIAACRSTATSCTSATADSFLVALDARTGEQALGSANRRLQDRRRARASRR